MIDEIQDVAIILLDKDGTILSWNKGAQIIKGYTDQEIVGQNFNIFYMPQDRQAGYLKACLLWLLKKEEQSI